MIKARWGIFSIYDENGAIHQYIYYYLDNIRKCFDRLIIVCNGRLDEEAGNHLRKYTNEIIVRENIGGDAGAYQHIILNYLDAAELANIDELVLLNDTMFGPFVDMQTVFHKMENEKYHFWGITQNDNICLPSHIQSYFIGMKKEMLSNECFLEFWKALDVRTNNIKIVVCNFEIGLTSYFQESGFTWGTLAGETKEFLYANPYFFLKEKQVPFIKRKSFGAYGITQSELEKVIWFIQNNTRYPLEYICEDVKLKYSRNVFNGYALSDKNITEDIHHLPQLSLKEVLTLLEPYKKVFVYGLTIYGISLAKCVKNREVEFVVSNEYYNERFVNGIKVSRFSEIQEDRQSCMVVALSAHMCEEMRQRLKWNNVIYYC